MKRLFSLITIILMLASSTVYATVSSSTSRTKVNCTGAIIAVPFTFGVNSSTELEVIKTVTSTGVETTLTETTDYTVSCTNNDCSSGGTVTTVAACASGSTMTVLRAIPLTQESDFTEGMPTLYSTFEASLDKLTRQVQQLQEQINRIPILKKSTALTGPTLAEPTAGQYLRWNTGATGVESTASVSSSGNHTPSGTGATTRTVDAKLGEEISVLDYGANGDGNDDAAAVQALINQVCAGTLKRKLITFPDPSVEYAFTAALSIPALCSGLTLKGTGNGVVDLKFSSATGNGIAFAGEASYITISNINITSTASSTGTGIIAAGVGVLRDILIENFYVDGFTNGISLAWGINGTIRNGRVTGLGKATASSTGVKFYSVGGHDTTTMTIDGVYVSDFETNHDIDGNGHQIRRSISSTSGYHYHSKGQVSLSDAWVEGVDTAADKIFKTTAGLFSIRGFIKAYSTLGASVEQSSPAFYDLDATGKESALNQFERTRIRAYLNTAVQTTTTATPAKVAFNAVSHDRHTEWDGATNFRYTAVRPGYYRISSTVYWASAALDHWVSIYKGGAAFSKIIKGGVANDNMTSIADTLFLDIGEYIEIWVSQASGGDKNITNGEEKTWVTIDEL